MVLKMTWNSKEPILAAPRRPPSSKNCRNSIFSAEVILEKGFDVVEWTDEFEKVCSFSTLSKDENSFSPYNVSFNLLYGQKGDTKNKLTVIGTASINIAELALHVKEPQIERKLPIALQSDGCGAATKATLSISVSFIEMRDEMADEGFLMRKVRDLASGYRSKKSNSKKKAKKTESVEDHARVNNGSSGDSDESTIFDSDGSPSNSSGSTESHSFWKKRRLSFRSSKIKNKDPLNQPINSTWKKGELGTEEGFSSLESDSNGGEGLVECWVEKDLISRDGDAKIRSEVFFASIDQRSERAAGESACTAVVAVIADWIQSNRDAMPTKSEFDGLIVEGSSEWQRLCSNDAYIGQFPDKHFDLETVLEANLRPVSVMPIKSFVGFFCPERFESLKGAMSFDEIWDEISRNVEEGEPNVYIVSWNDHFFLLKMDCDACYIIDSLGERLFEGCKQAYVLKFSDKTRMYNLVDKTEKLTELDGKREDSGNKNGGSNVESCGEEQVVCSGKECCRDYFKRFLAAISLKELEMEEKRGTVPSAFLHQRLQIEFHFCRDSSSSSLSSSSSTSDCLVYKKGG